jgi:DNA-binding transcriptional LysR family regulator
MNLRRVDLNLLIAFEALMSARHVTRAAKAVGIGQPGMSAALARLRQLFADELLVKHGGAMVPTARARELEPDIRRILRDVERLVSEPARFDAATSPRTFQLRMSDLLSVLLLPAVAARFGVSAPHVRLEIAHLGPEATLDALERNTIELAVSTALKFPKSIDTAALFDDRIVVAARRDHPARRRMRTIEGLLSLPQVKIAQSPIDDRFADRQLAKLGHKRRVAMTLPHWLAVPEIVARSDLVAIMPYSIARRFLRDGGIVLMDPPFPDTSFTWSLYWHRRHASDSGGVWLRRQLIETARDLAMNKRKDGRTS